MLRIEDGKFYLWRIGIDSGWVEVEPSEIPSCSRCKTLSISGDSLTCFVCMRPIQFDVRGNVFSFRDAVKVAGCIRNRTPIPALIEDEVRLVNPLWLTVRKDDW